MEYMPFTLCLVSMILFYYNHMGCSGCLEVERIALLELKASMNMPNLNPPLTWDDEEGSDCCAWERVKCSNTTRQVIQLSLSNIHGDVQYVNAALFLPFDKLQHLDLSNNSISELQGLDRLSRLTKLHFLKLEKNYFNNSILPSLGALISLNTLDLGRNMLDGSLSQLPQVWSNMSKLKILYLGENNFSGGIPPSLLTLSSLEALSLDHNNLTGSISGLCELKNLRDLDLSENKFEGIIPPCISNLTSLRLLDFSENQLYGKIPTSLISNLNSLEFISLGGNQFDGGLPFTSPLSDHKLQLKLLSIPNCNLNLSTTDLLKFFHNQHDLRYLDLSHNNLHGRFPNWLVENNTRLETLLLRNSSLTGSIQLSLVVSLLLDLDASDNHHIVGKLQPDIGVVLSKLVFLNLSKNSIEGTLPTSLGNMKDLVVLDFSSNKFSGEIPDNWALNLKQLKGLILSNNNLHGGISSSLFNLTFLDTLRLSDNQFTGNIPNHNVGSFGLCIFDLSQNQLSGEIPSWIGMLPNLRTLILGNNSFHGLIPLEFCYLLNLEFLDLSYNHLSGSIPSYLRLPALKYMHLQGNKLSGSIPEAILQSSDLMTLDLKHNNLSGNIPDWFGLLSNLRVLLLKGNHLNGSVSSQLCQLEKISILDLSYNKFFGPIPPCFTNISFGKIGPVERVGALTMIKALNLSHNYLTGSIPRTLSNLTQLESMDVSYNKLTGEIPSELTDINNLAVFNVSYNNLSGKIPDMKAQFNTFDESSYRALCFHFVQKLFTRLITHDVTNCSCLLIN
ncbi:hypothetical protein AQUCO_02000022v1 [Aquilegia coerulea]|uniref:Leucine-rich repeat-containing N-terminal plant-type domain-containing protein n=1 Tax=Aquilegia coerulea TaxID=218851 RepID=A0A2G5DFI1_AQUCA|nr:hypothetical protein AQUCO_02000022v1 [Aquilegia coerulea]